MIQSVIKMGAVVAKIAFKSGSESIPRVPRKFDDIEVKDIDGRIIRVSELIEGKKAALVVNVATK